MQALSVTLLATLVACAGCGGDSLERQIADFSQPTTALASANSELVRLVREVELQRGLPTQLDAPELPPDDNAAAALADAYSPPLHLRLGPQVEPLVDPSTDNRQRTAFMKRHELLLSKTAHAIDLPNYRPKVGHQYGFFARMGYLDDATLAARLMTARSFHHATLDQVTEAFGDTVRALRVAHELSRVKRVEARRQAATLRFEALTAAKALFEAGIYERFEAEQLYGLLRDQLVDWPSDSRMLVGERATVVHSYEVIRGGMLDRLLVSDERRRLEEGGLLAAIQEASVEALDADEASYLKTMQALLGVADLPQHERLETILRAREDANRPPRLAAAALFLVDLPVALRATAEDRALCEAWTIALAGVGELRMPPYRTSPLTGEDYSVDRAFDSFAVTYGAGPEDVVVLPPVLP